jgi:hypothetical protein
MVDAAGLVVSASTAAGSPKGPAQQLGGMRLAR